MINGVARKYDRLAVGFSESSYANLQFYMCRRLILARSWGTKLQPGDTVLELGCGDGYLAELFVQQGFHYSGVDLSPNMVTAAEQRLQRYGLSARFMAADVNQMMWQESYDAVVAYMRTFFTYIHDPLALLKQLHSYVRKKVIIDFSPREFSLHNAMAVMREAGFRDVIWRPFFVPKDKRFPLWLVRMLVYGEEIPLLRSIPLRWKFHCLLQGRP